MSDGGSSSGRGASRGGSRGRGGAWRGGGDETRASSSSARGSSRGGSSFAASAPRGGFAQSQPNFTTNNRGRGGGCGGRGGRGGRLWQTYEREFTSTVDAGLVAAKTISLMSYNLLAQSLCDAADFPVSSANLLPWQVRERKLIAEISREAADVVCIQELDETDSNK